MGGKGQKGMAHANFDARKAPLSISLLQDGNPERGAISLFQMTPNTMAPSDATTNYHPISFLVMVLSFAYDQPHGSATPLADLPESGLTRRDAFYATFSPPFLSLCPHRKSNSRSLELMSEFRLSRSAMEESGTGFASPLLSSFQTVPCQSGWLLN